MLRTSQDLTTELKEKALTLNLTIPSLLFYFSARNIDHTVYKSSSPTVRALRNRGGLIYIYIYIYGRVVIPPPLHFSIFGSAPNTKDVLTLVMPHTAKCGINPYISIHMTEVQHIHGPDCIKYEYV